MVGSRLLARAADTSPDSATPVARPPARRVLLRVLLGLLLTLYFTLTIGYLALRYYVWPNLDDWRPQIAAHLSGHLRQPVSLGRLQTSFDGWWRPMLQVDQIAFGEPGAAAPDQGQAPLRVRQVLAVLSPRSFLIGRIRLAQLQVEGLAVSVRRDPAGALWVAGRQLRSADADASASLDELLAQRRIELRDASVEWIDETIGQRMSLTGVNAELENLGRRHRLSARASAVQGVSGALGLVGELYRTPLARSDELTSWQGDLYASMDRVSAQALQAASAIHLPFSHALADLHFWSRLEAGRLQDMTLKLAGDSMQIDIADGVPLTIERFGLDASAIRRGDGGHDLVIRDFIAHADGDFALRAIGAQTLSISAAGALERGKLAIEDVELARALAWARRSPLVSARVKRALQPLKLRGRLSGLSAQFAIGDQLALDAQMKFDGLSILMPVEAPPPDANGKQPPGLPSLENVSGTASIRADGGTMSFAGRNASLTFPGVFAEPRVPMDSLRARLDWKLGATDAEPAVSVVVQDLVFANRDAAGTMAGEYRTGGRGPGIANLRGSLTRGDATRVARYLPMQMPVKVRSWVRESITGGRIAHAAFAVNGDLDDFPFRDPASGEFWIDARLADGTLDYAPREWPRVEKLNGRLRFVRTSMDIAMDGGRMYGFDLKDTSAKIDDFSTPLLTIAGQGKGPVQDMVRFINDSPLRVRIDDFTRNTVARGDARLELKLDLPLENLRETRVHGAVVFERNDLTLDDTLPPFEDVSGRLEFSDAGLQLKGINARFMGGPLHVEGETPEAGRFLLRARGRLSAQDMRNVIANPLTERLQGAADYRARIDVRQHAATVTIDSDLVGLSSDLPEPFNKPSASAWPIHVVATPHATRSADDRSGGDTISATLNGNVHLAFARRRDPASNRLLIERGAFAYAAEPTMLDRGFVVQINRKDIDLDRWLDLLTGPGLRASGDGASREFAEGFSMLPTVVSIVADRAVIGGKELNQVVFGASRQGGFWRANISAREVDGYFTWSEARADQRIGALSARFTRLEIPNSRRGEIESLLEAPPADLPALDVSADEFVLADQSLGRLHLKASNSGGAANPVWHLDSLSIDNPAARFEASGLWARPAADAPRRTELKYRLEVADSGELLDRFGMRNVIRGGVGSLSGTLSWDASPFALQYPSLRGTTNLAIGKGQFLKTEPGIAKLIGVLNMQFLSRRLSLDFTDLFAEGFSFDDINGDFVIDKGVATTDEIAINGVSARVRMKGRIDLAAETQNIEALVRPELNAGIASLAYAALANPALGLTTFVAQALLRRPLEDMFTATYEISGSWTEPKVTVRRRVPVERPPFLP